MDISEEKDHALWNWDWESEDTDESNEDDVGIDSRKKRDEAFQFFEAKMNAVEDSLTELREAFAKLKSQFQSCDEVVKVKDTPVFKNKQVHKVEESSGTAATAPIVVKDEQYISKAFTSTSSGGLLSEEQINNLCQKILEEEEEELANRNLMKGKMDEVKSVTNLSKKHKRRQKAVHSKKRKGRRKKH